MPDLTECAANIRALEKMVEQQFARIAPPKPREVDVEALPDELGPEPENREAVTSLAHHLAAAAVICGVFLPVC
jgi:hypothetical protein